MSSLDNSIKEDYLNRLSIVEPQLINEVSNLISCKLTATDIAYIICFVVDMKIDCIAQMFNVEKASVYTARYRIKKKLKDNIALKFII